MNKTNIAWTDFTWNPITGCSAVSDGCKNCYAKTVHERFNDTPFNDIKFHEKRLDLPFARKKSAKIFVGSMTDLFQPSVPFEWIDQVMEVIYHSPQHTFQILTKRPKIMEKYFYRRSHYSNMKNVWIGATVENQKEANKRIPTLLRINADKHFISIEPMLEAIDLYKFYFQDKLGHHPFPYLSDGAKTKWTDLIDWVIVGGETGTKNKTRPMDSEWVRKIYSDCVKNNIPFFFKQWGAHKPNCKSEFEDIKEFPK